MHKDFKISVAELTDKLDCSYDYMNLITAGFMERNERIFYRKPTVNSDGQMEYADLVDNTLASYLDKMPKNVIQKMPSFTIDAHNRDKAEDLAYEYIAKEIILRSGSSKGYGLLQKQWITLRNAATYGACAVYLPFLREYGEYTVGFEYIYWGDLYPEAYANNINSANYIQFRSMKTKGDLEKILEGLDDEKGGTWNKEGIQTVLDFGVGQTTGNDTRPLKVQLEGLPQGMYELFVYVDSDWVVYWHNASQTILRVIPNRSGRARVVGLYSDFDGSSLMGRSLVDMAFAQQQSLTSLLRNFIYTSDYNTDPAKLVKGVNLNEDSFNLVKGNTMFMSEEDGGMELLTTDTTTIQNFPQLYQLLKGVLLNSLPSSNETLPAGSGDPNQSKTQAGVNSQDAKADIENNYYRKNYETFFEMVLENQLNIYLAEIREIARLNEAVPIVKVNEEYANLIRMEDPSKINERNEVALDLSNTHGVSVSVDFESTRALAKEEDLQRLNTFMTGFFEAAKSDPSMASVMRSVMPLLMEEMTKSSNLENSAKIAEVMKEALEEAKQQERQAAAAQQEQEGAQALPEVKPPTVSIAFKDLPPAGKVQAAAMYGIELTAEDMLPGMAQQAADPTPEQPEMTGGMM